MTPDELRKFAALEGEIYRLRQLLFTVHADSIGQWRGLIQRLGTERVIQNAEMTERAIETWMRENLEALLDEANRRITRLERLDREPPPAGPAPHTGPGDPGQ